LLPRYRTALGLLVGFSQALAIELDGVVEIALPPPRLRQVLVVRRAALTRIDLVLVRTLHAVLPGVWIALRGRWLHESCRGRSAVGSRQSAGAVVLTGHWQLVTGNPPD